MISLLNTLLICVTIIIVVFRITSEGIMMFLETVHSQEPVEVQEVPQTVEDKTNPTSDPIVGAVHEILDLFEEDGGDNDAR